MKAGSGGTDRSSTAENKHTDERRLEKEASLSSRKKAHGRRISRRKEHSTPILMILTSRDKEYSLAVSLKCPKHLIPVALFSGGTDILWSIGSLPESQFLCGASSCKMQNF
jgi:hypothetical protein